ncbi:MAG TPA: sigma-54 dependent transcriptional regulator [Azospirillaceae bacterium]|nr:sigma-54 dependent transcriptional regulator [Azospirillaceae bacterium]
MPTILIVDDEVAIRTTLDLHFREQGFSVRTAAAAEAGLAALDAGGVDAVVTDIRMPGRDGLWLLGRARERDPRPPVIVMTAFHDLDSTIAAMQAGAAEYIRKPIDLNELDEAVDRALREHGTGAGDGLTVDETAAPQRMVGNSRTMREVFKSIGLVARSRATALILGESGTGKELVAHAIHAASPDHAKPFVAINCAALVETLLESEMFGHERGAFTGAVAAHKGKVELAGDGTLFLDEVAELSPAMQGKLLRVLEEREYTPVGGPRPKRTDARFIAATNVSLAERVAQGRFREDLYYRLNVVTIKLPALRERREDIAPLIENLIRKINRDLCRGIRRISAEAMERLVAYDWPGNVRELENVLMRAAVMEPGDTLTATHLSAEVASARPPMLTAPCGTPAELAGPYCSLKELERDYIERVLAATGWHKGKTCEILGISRPRLERRIREFDLKAPDGRMID